MVIRPGWIRAGLPKGFSIAGKSGTGPTVDGHLSAWNDMGIVTSPSGRHMIVAAYLRDSTLSDADRCAIFADLGRVVAAAM